jgi:uncharacterized protein YifE (UPF0438 family)
MWASMLVLFVVHHFTSNPTHMWHGSLFKQLPNTQRMGLPFPTHTHKTKTKIIVKIKNPKNSIERAKKEKRKPTRENRHKKKFHKLQGKKNIKNKINNKN